MTTTTAMTTSAPSVLAELVDGGMQHDVSMMIGIGINKDSDAVFFQYLGNEQPPAALTIPSNGKPVTTLWNVRLVGIEIAEDVGTFKSTKLNLFLESERGNVVMLTAGLTTLWSQCIMTGLSGMYQSYDLNTVTHDCSDLVGSAVRTQLFELVVKHLVGDLLLTDFD